MRKLTQSTLLTAVLAIVASVPAFADDPNGPRPGLIDPPKQSERTPVSVPDAGSSVVLLGAALAGLGGKRWLAGRLARGG